MGEEGKKEESNAEVNPDENKEEKQEPKKDDEKVEEKEEEKKKEEPPPPAPLILSLNLHCMGCVKKIERTILKCRGVEGVETNMESDQVVVRGIVDPEALCSRIRKRTRKQVKVISPVLPPRVEGDGNKSQLVASQVGDITTVELHVNMHCEACAQQLRRKLLKMRGVLTVDVDLSSCQVKVTGSMDADRLVKYVHKRTRKQVQVVPQPPKEEEKVNNESEKSSEDYNSPTATEEKKEESKEEKTEAKVGEEKQEVPSESEKEEKVEENKGESNEEKIDNKDKEENQPKAEVIEGGVQDAEDVENGKRMVYYWAPMYSIERLPPPQLFSDENPNACSIS